MPRERRRRNERLVSASIHLSAARAMLRDQLILYGACIVPSALLVAVARSLWTDYSGKLVAAGTPIGVAAGAR